MADQSCRVPQGIAKDVPVKIMDHYVLTDFLVMDMEEDEDSPIVLGRPFLNTTRAIIYIHTGEIHFHFPNEKVRVYFNSYTTYMKPGKSRSARRRQRERWIMDPNEEKEETDNVEVQEEVTPPTPEQSKEKEGSSTSSKKNPPAKRRWRKKKTSPIIRRINWVISITYRDH